MAYDFSGYATRNDIRCADGRTIRKGAFKDCDGKTVPLVWMHQHNEPTNTLGHALLENRDDGVYAYGSFNETENGKYAKQLIQHGDITSLSIYANRLKQDQDMNVYHGQIREVSLVMAGANPGAYIDAVSMGHSEDGVELEEGIIYSGLKLCHEAEDPEEPEPEPAEVEEEAEEAAPEEAEHSDQNEEEEALAMSDTDRTIGDVIDGMTEEQQKVLYYLVGQAAEGSDNPEGGEDVKHNLFDVETDETEVLTHDEMTAIFAEAKRNGSLRDTMLEHGITNLDYLFPDAKTVTPTPELIMRRTEWVSKVLNGVSKSPFARIKSTAANLTMDEARARGYIKGKKKIEQQFALLKRATTPQTVYKLQKIDRDDVIDITDFDVVAFMKTELRAMLDEELGRAVLVGDGRTPGTDDKIDPTHIRPIYGDEDTYTIYYTVDYDEADDVTDKANKLVAASLRSRKEYRGSGSPVLFSTNDVITDMMLATDKMGRKLYSTEAELAAALRVKDIIEVPVLEGVTRMDDEDEYHELVGIIVNLSDYKMGADKGGEVNMFDDFDIDYNKYEYLIETRCSGALYKPYSAICLERDVTGVTGVTGESA